jgi:DNA-binding LacI/PurR family transcriptional regulator
VNAAEHHPYPHTGRTFLSIAGTFQRPAKAFQTAFQTVSKVLHGQMQVSDKVQKRIFAAAKEMGYRPNAAARNLRTQST